MIKVNSIGEEYCLPCADILQIEGVIVEREGECLFCAGGKIPESYLITFEITTPTDPNEWDWDSFLNLDENESYRIYSIGQITRNNKERVNER